MLQSKRKIVEHSLVKSDNLAYLLRNRVALEGMVDFIYIDPTSYAGKPASGSAKVKHQKWVDFMEPRLSASAPFLKDTGVIAVSIDDVELARLRLLLDDVFGEENFIGLVVVESGNVHNNARLLSISHEYLLLYAKNLKQLLKTDVRWRQEREGLDVLRKHEKRLRKEHGEDFPAITAELKAWLKDQPLPKRLKQFYNADAKGLYSYSDLSAPGTSLTYEVVHPVTGKPVSLPGRGWGLAEDSFHALIEQDLIIWGDTEKSQPLKKLYLKDTPDQVIRGVVQSPARTPVNLLKKILGEDQPFQSPKSLEFVKYVVDVMSPSDALVLDFFAGSGTTGHAILDLNYENPESERRFILVNSNEKQTFSQVLKPRIEAVVSGRWADRQHRPRKATLNIVE